MATKDQIKKVILDIAGNPTVGAIADHADKWAEAIVALDAKSSSSSETKDDTIQDGTSGQRPSKEIRVTKPAEKR
jgi:hypothetical protein